LQLFAWGIAQNAGQDGSTLGSASRNYGRITACRGAMGFGIRIDGGTACSGAVVTRLQ
jgi:hypothetical protein